MTDEARHLRIGELSRRSGASTDVLRAWERRYGLLRPARSPKGYRLYSEGDLRRALEMQARLAGGIAPAEAAALVKAAEHLDVAESAAVSTAPDLLVRLRFALTAYNAIDAAQVLDRCFLTLGLAQAIQLVILPCFRELGRRWEHGEITVAQEHFATEVVRRRLLSVAAGWDAEGDRVALLACPPGEQHDIGLVCFGVALNTYHGWRITYLGADTPQPALADAARTIRPDVIAMSAVSAARFFPDLDRWRELAGGVPLAIGGAGADARLAKRMGAVLLGGDPVSAAARLASAA